MSKIPASGLFALCLKPIAYRLTTMNILFLCHRIPYPPNKGEKIRSYNILKHLVSRHNVHLAFLVDNTQDLTHIKTLRPLVKSLHYDVINPKFKKLRSSIALLESKPISVPYFYSPNLQNEIDTLLGRENIDCILCYSSPTAEYVFRSKIIQDGRGRTASLGRGKKKQNHNGKPETTSKLQSSVPSPQSSGSSPQSSVLRPMLIMDFIDLDSYKWTQYAERSRFPMQWVYKHEAKYLQRYEAKIAIEFDHSFFTSEDEKKLFLDQSPCNDITAMSNGVDTDFFNPRHQSPLKKNGKTLIFTGMMDYLPNVEGITWFSEKILPSIQCHYPNTTLYIVGNQPSPDVKSLANRKGIIVTGFVEDIRDYLSIADICIAPLRIARGVQNKVLEAMAMGKPTVCTAEILSGISATAGKDIAIATDEKTFSEQIINLLSDPDKANQLGTNARRFVEENASWDAQLEILDKVLRGN